MSFFKVQFADEYCRLHLKEGLDAFIRCLPSLLLYKCPILSPALSAIMVRCLHDAQGGGFWIACVESWMEVWHVALGLLDQCLPVTSGVPRVHVRTVVSGLGLGFCACNRKVTSAWLSGHTTVGLLSKVP